MKATALTLCLAAAPFALAEPLWATRKQPFEIQAIRYAETGECDVITFRQTQIVKGLDFGEAYVTSLQTATGDERLSIISYEEEALQARFYSLCIHNKWEGNTNELYREGEQEILSPKIPSARQAVVSSSYPPLEVLPLNVSGPSSNRVDLVFFSDGYLAEEKAKFLEDAKRLADDISNNHTFNTVKPLMNFWAAFTRSNESGIGTGGRTKDTPFGLYRDGTELRGVYYSKPAVARAACLALGSQCDFPILVGNDPLYGGLGGEFT
ncbi:hypothetical protein NM688_g9184 [Phlebia brevispora]|uniref:Uncharacterized protein n=1 Tax=Phlebia brevispora TaxID=194682 RepID=A0ACC1RL33_9APHY|nr:hypothetical protein NM688_g9184 [Phlebia brevispora]